VNDLLGNRTQFTIDGLVTLYPLIQSGKLRALAVARPERWPALPDVPTMVESGYPDFVLDAWSSLLAPAGTPPEIITKLNAAVNEGLQTQATKDNLAKFSSIAKVGSPDDFRKFLADQTQLWGAMVKLADARVD
jgi:tripartite-type tricarboxylate transporter receptor subunit TctC